MAPVCGTLVSIQVGRPRELGGRRRPWRSGIYKTPVAAPVWLGRLNLEGDGQADLQVHGGADRAVLAYSADHYPLWRSELRRTELPYGSFGENFTIAGLTEAGVCIGDVFALGDTRLEVSQPRLPCWKLARRLRLPTAVARAQRSGRSGWYLRVLEEGEVAAGQPITLLRRPHPEWSVPRAVEAYTAGPPGPQAAELAGLAALSERWRRRLAPASGLPEVAGQPPAGAGPRDEAAAAGL